MARHLIASVFLLSFLVPWPVSSQGNEEGRATLPDVQISQPGLNANQGGSTGAPRSPTISFPDLDFLPGPMDIPVTCSMRSSCQADGREALPYRDVNCFCDPLCSVFGDCCKDYKPPSPSMGQPVKIQPKMVQCERLLDYNREVEVYVVSSCPRRYRDPEIIRQCEYSSEHHADFFYQLPVSGLDSGILYKNYYCALCAGDSNVSFWSVDIDCDHPPDGNVTADPVAYMDKIVQESSDDWYSCHKKLSHPTIQVRKCKSAISRCTKGASKKLKRKCRKETSYVYAGKEVFKNKYCAQCYGMNETYLSCEDTRIPSRDPDSGFGVQRFSPFSLTLNFDNGKGLIQDLRVGVSGERHVAIPFADIKQCEASHIYDPFSKQCRLKMCPRDSQLLDGQCVILPANPTPSREKPDKPGNLPGIKVETPDGSSVEVDLPNLFPPDDGHSLHCPSMKLTHTEYEMFKNGTVLVPSLGRMFGPRDYEYQLPFLYICKQPARPTSSTGGKNKNRNMNKNNNGMKTDYDNSKIKGKNTTNALVMFQFNRMQGLVSFVSVLVSLVAMLIMFIVYLMLPPLRNVPGKNIMCLTFSLFVAQILYLVGVPRTEWFEVCLGLAAAMHYFWLAAFFWMNVLAFDIWRTFVSRVNKSSEKARTCRFVGYSFYAWFMPALIVAAALVLDFQVFEGIDEIYLPHYGKDICWIAHRHALLFLFALPLAILLLTNLIFYLATMINICRISRMTDIQNRGKDRCRLCIYVKLSLVMGLTWVFGFLAALLKMELFWYLFIGFNAFQGVFICFAFVLNKKVFKLLSSKGRAGNRRQQSSDFRACTNGVRGGPGSSATNRSYFSDSSAKVIAQETSI